MDDLRHWAARVEAERIHAETLAAGVIPPILSDALSEVLRTGVYARVAGGVCGYAIASRAARIYGLHCLYDRHNDVMEFRREPYGPLITKEEKSQYMVVL